MSKKQEERVEQFIQEVRDRFPETNLLKISEMPDRSIWVKMKTSSNNALEIMDYTAQRTIDILLEDGYHILISVYEPDEMQIR